MECINPCVHFNFCDVVRKTNRVYKYYTITYEYDNDNNNQLDMVLSLVGIMYKFFHDLFCSFQKKYEQRITRLAEEHQEQACRQAKEAEVNKLLRELNKDEISLLKYVQGKSGVFWLPNDDVRVLGLRTVGLIDFVDKDKDLSRFRGDEFRVICSPYILTTFTKDNRSLITQFLTEHC